jgi:hypothetical protein
VHWIRVQILIFHKKIFWKQIRGNSLFEYNWHETAIFTKHKHVILTWENSLKYSAWQLSFAFSYKCCYIEKIWKTWWYPTMDDSHVLYFKLFSHVSIIRFCIVDTAVSCQLYSSTNLILICFQNICFEKEVFAPYFSAHMHVFMLKNLNFLQGKR